MRDVIESYFRDLRFDEGPAAAAAIVIAKNADVSIEVRGFSDIENAVPAVARSRFHVASLAKQFTALLVARFISRGAITMDTPIGEILPWLLSPVRNCRIRHLLFHTSGIRDQWAMGYFSGLRSTDEILTSDIETWLSREETLNFTSGSRFLYCNTGYTLLALALEQLAAKSFAELAREEVFVPLGMLDTLFLSDPQSRMDGRVRAYCLEGDKLRAADPNYGVIGSTCLRTSARDMAKWLTIDLAGEVFGTVRDVGFFEPGHLDDGTPIKYGFGLIHSEIAGVPVLMHGGYDLGFNAAFIRAKDSGTGVFACGSGSFSTLEQSAMNAFRACSGKDVRSPKAMEAHNPAGTSPLQPGVYANADFSDVRAIVNRPRGTQVLEWMQGFDLTPIQGTSRYQVVGSPLKLMQIDDELVFEDGADSFRLSLQEAEPYDLNCLLGSYFCSLSGATATIMSAPGGPVIKVGRNHAVPLTIVNQRLMHWKGYWAVLTSDHTGLRLEMSHSRCLRVVFEKVG